MPEPRLSIIIPTRNRRELLAKVLDSLERLRANSGELEILVVDDGSADGTPEFVANRSGRWPLRCLRQDSQGPAAARNRGAAEARGEILGFLDSDVLVEPEWWQAAAGHFRDLDVCAVEGATLPPPGSARPTPFTHYVRNDRGGSYQSCNFLVRATCFRQVGGFDPRFGVRLRSGALLYSREDSDLAFSLLETGQRIVFEPKALARHPLPAPNFGLQLHLARYGLQEPLLRRKHPKLYRQQLKWVDGRAFPVFYLGVYAGTLTAGVGLACAWWPVILAGKLLWLLGTAGAVYACCRKRSVPTGELLLLSAQMLVLPWWRAYWVARGEWRFRSVKPHDR